MCAQLKCVRRVHLHIEAIAESCEASNVDRREKASSLLDPCQAGVFELWVPGGAAACGCEIEDGPQEVGVRGPTRVLAEIGNSLRCPDR
jgi:hypothetical protein